MSCHKVSMKTFRLLWYGVYSYYKTNFHQNELVRNIFLQSFISRQTTWCYCIQLKPAEFCRLLYTRSPNTPAGGEGMSRLKPWGSVESSHVCRAWHWSDNSTSTRGSKLLMPPSIMKQNFIIFCYAKCCQSRIPHFLLILIVPGSRGHLNWHIVFILD